MSEGLGATWIVLQQTLYKILPWVTTETKDVVHPEMLVPPIWPPPCFPDSPPEGNKRPWVSWNKGMQDVCVCVCVCVCRCRLPTFLSECPTCQFLCGRKEEAQNNPQKRHMVSCILADKQTAGSVRICWHQIMNCYTLCQRFPTFPIIFNVGFRFNQKWWSALFYYYFLSLNEI